MKPKGGDLIERPTLNTSLGDIVADNACMRTRPGRIGEPYAQATRARVELATVLPAMAEVFGADGFGGLGLARRMMWKHLRGLPVADEIEARGMAPADAGGDFLTGAELALLACREREQPHGSPLQKWSTRVAHGHVSRGRMLLVSVSGVTDDWERVALAAPDAAARFLPADTIIRLLRLCSTWREIFASPYGHTRDMVDTCCVFEAWRGDAWTRCPIGEVKIPLAAPGHPAGQGEIRLTGDDVHGPAETLARALTFVGVAITADEVQGQIGHRYRTLREAWRTGRFVRLPNGRTIPPRVMPPPLPLPPNVPAVQRAARDDEML